MRCISRPATPIDRPIGPRRSITVAQKPDGFGSYGRGDAGVGSDLDLLLIDAGSSGPQHQRLLAWPLAELPLSCDALVLTPSEHAELLASGSAMAAALQRDSRWLWHR